MSHFITPKQLEQIAFELKSTSLENVHVNVLPIGETCVEFTNLGKKYQAFFNTKTEKLVSFIFISVCGMAYET